MENNTAQSPLIVDYLANHEHLIPVVAQTLYAEWGELYSASGLTQSGLMDELTRRAVKDRLPITMVALEGGSLAGTGSIKLDEPGTKPGVSPWLAGMYVHPAYRGRGVGSLILHALERKAEKLRVPGMYLSTDHAEAFYARHGWSVMERAGAGAEMLAVMFKSFAPPPR